MDLGGSSVGNWLYACSDSQSFSPQVGEPCEKNWPRCVPFTVRRTGRAAYLHVCTRCRYTRIGKLWALRTSTCAGIDLVWTLSVGEEVVHSNSV